MKAKLYYRQIAVLMIHNGIDSRALADLTGIPYSTLRRRLRGDSPFTLDEAICIHSLIGGDMTIEQLFSHE